MLPRSNQRLKEASHLIGVGTRAHTHLSSFCQTQMVASARRGPKQVSLGPFISGSQLGEAKRGTNACLLVTWHSGAQQQCGSLGGVGFTRGVWGWGGGYSRDALRSRGDGSTLRKTTKYLLKSPAGNCFRMLQIVGSLSTPHHLSAQEASLP